MLSLFNFPDNLKTLSDAIPEGSGDKAFMSEFLKDIMISKSIDKSSLAKILNLSGEQIESLLNGEKALDQKIMTRIKEFLAVKHF